jgi:hypothetical protein
MLAYNLNCWLQLFNREPGASVETMRHTTLATARLRKSNRGSGWIRTRHCHAAPRLRRHRSWRIEFYAPGEQSIQSVTPAALRKSEEGGKQKQKQPANNRHITSTHQVS